MHKLFVKYNLYMPQQRTDVRLEEIKQAVAFSNLQGFTGNYTELGGGEVNETFILNCGGSKAILRITKYSDVNNLNQEARAFGLLDLSRVPKLIYFNEAQRINDKGWIIESYIQGQQVNGLTIKQFEKLGELLAQIHKVQSKDTIKLDFWDNFLDASQHFGNEQTLLNHPDTKLNELIHRAYSYFQSLSDYSIT